MRLPRMLAALGVALVACSPGTPAADSTAASAPAAAATPAPDPAVVRAYIDSVNKATFAAAMAGDFATWVSVYEDDAIVMNPGSPAWRGRAAIEEGLRGMLAGATPEGGTFTSEDVKLAGDLAIETGNYELSLKLKSGGTVNDKGKYLTVWRRQPDGGWRIIRDINNSNAAPQ